MHAHTSQVPLRSRPSLLSSSLSNGLGGSFSSSLSGSSTSSSLSLYPGDYSQLPLSPTTTEYPAFISRTAGLSPGPNFQGSWLDIETDDEDDTIVRRGTQVGSRRKSSGSSLKELSQLCNPMPGIRGLTHRSTMQLRKLSIKKAR